MTRKPNVLFFFADDQRFDTIAALGNPDVHTPNLDELVRQGVTFKQAHIPGGTVPAVCMPSRAMLHTGRSLFQLKDDGSTIPEEYALLGETLRDHGYRTVGVGKWHNGNRAYARSFTDGGEIFFGGMTDHWNVPAYDYDPSGRYDKTLKIIESPFENNRVRERQCDHIHAGKHSTELFCDFAARWLKNNQSAEPWFMYVSLLAPHDPRSMPDRFHQMYDPAAIELPPNFMSDHPFVYGAESIRDERLAESPRNEKEIRRHIAEYYGMISHLDDELGKLLAALRETGQYFNTIIVFAADNGLAVGQHGLMGKQSAYEHSVRVPLVVSGPDIPRNETRDDFIYLLDVFPTLCDLLEMPIPPTVEGHSFVHSLKHNAPGPRSSLYFAYADLVRSVKTSRFKLIEYRNGPSRQTQLFDLERDPWELRNLTGHEEWQQVEDELRQEMIRYRDSWGDADHPMGDRFWNGEYETKNKDTAVSMRQQ